MNFHSVSCIVWLQGSASISWSNLSQDLEFLWCISSQFMSMCCVFFKAHCIGVLWVLNHTGEKVITIIVLKADLVNIGYSAVKEVLRSWTRWSLWVPSSSGCSVILCVSVNHLWLNMTHGSGTFSRILVILRLYLMKLLFYLYAIWIYVILLWKIPLTSN